MMNNGIIDGLRSNSYSMTLTYDLFTFSLMLVCVLPVSISATVVHIVMSHVLYSE